jgi:hypothetical protein
MNIKIGPLALCLPVVLVCSCAATSVKKTWKAPDCQGPVGKIGVIAIEERGLLRQGVENRFVAQLRRDGAAALPTFDLLSLPQIKEDKRAAAERFRESGAEALLIVRLFDKVSTYREIQPAGERYVPMVTGIETTGWYDYYSLGLMSLSSTYGTVKDYVYIETAVYDLKTEKRLWSALTRTVVGENMDRFAEMDIVVEKVVTAMRKEGVIR